MTTGRETRISTEEFYARALAIEREAANRYWEFAHQLLLYRDHDAAEVFLELARTEYQHLRELESQAAGMKLPRRKRSEYAWKGFENPEGKPLFTAQCLMRPRQALKIALDNEHRARNFYDRMSALAPDAKTRRLAGKWAREEARHIEWIERALNS